MSGIFGGYFGPREIKYLFIDGGCLRECLARMSNTYAGGACLRPDYGTLTRAYSKVFYYDALPARKSDDKDESYKLRIMPQRSLFDHLSNLDRFHVYEGDVRRSAARRGPEQKKVDVMIAVDMLTHSFRRNMHEATLLTGDLDFKPLIDALVQEGMFVTLWYPPGETSKELIAAADRSERFSIRSVYDALPFPRPFEMPKTMGAPSKGEYAPVLKRIRVDESEVIVMKDGDAFVVGVSEPIPGRMTYHEYGDIEILRAYLEEGWGISLPELS
jgi:uncharacterized LabA/DUF88 family protein